MDEKKPNRREIFSDVLMLTGAVLLSVGIGMIDFEGGVIAAGILCTGYGVLVARGGTE